MNFDVKELKVRLPLPALMQRLGDGDYAKRKARCPFHEDQRPSFSVFQGRGGTWRWHCFAGCGGGDAVDYLKLKFGLRTGDAIRKYAELANAGRRTV